MKRKLYPGDKMYAVFRNNQLGKYVRPCTITEIENDGFWAECHNGGENGSEKGNEYFTNANIGTEIFFSKDSAELHCKKK